MLAFLSAMEVKVILASPLLLNVEADLCLLDKTMRKCRWMIIEAKL